ncbi:hypothetical protein CANCADRAFT_82729 [Tortispora caseinolytica NRRL Y-17796]|uniref:CDP-diacylglycerol--inositol 3-phosphatidyltransferase n=1 Tax=Tortispora caseinolytica NRRL Y-17796 TaxID=767744 RepID=A0A1E4TK69_9ASCO|nr:hypothetical protein CANCADRAFT_82729 [Tortispora caseinolytica NRRL Y-17796]
MSSRVTRSASKQKETKQLEANGVSSIFLFIPNIIGYCRVILAGGALWKMAKHPKVCVVLYGLSCLLDALDGAAARKFDQSTQFGAVLDMVTDRCTTSSLICFLCTVYSQYTIFFQLLVSLDLASHYMHMVAMTHRGASSHKKVDRKQSRILNLYYTNTTVLFTVCAANELFFVGLYMAAFPLPTPPNLGYWHGIPLSYKTAIIVLTFPLWLLKQVINVIQLVRAALTLANADYEERLKRQLKSS